ncbi:hypothetical protein BDQ12DRAFT_663509 [Crucibulum laeve]|uniref:Uncharacterized protein n=1 Tax=Crucibulum laeve TaxID=68775 RepID=A0A5C3MD09_9AGAR|nr:hypothetical protein BDQ12DRAFT_663509 [Crucibulum laeve]
MSNNGPGKSQTFFYGARNSHFDHLNASNIDGADDTFQGTPEDIAVALSQSLGNVKPEDKERKVLSHFENISNCTFTGGNFKNVGGPSRVFIIRPAASTNIPASTPLARAPCQDQRNASSSVFALQSSAHIANGHGTRAQYFPSYGIDDDVAQIEEVVEL